MVPSRQGQFTSRWPLSFPDNVHEFLDHHCGEVTSIRALPRGKSIMLLVTCQQKANLSQCFGFGFGFTSYPEKARKFYGHRSARKLGFGLTDHSARGDDTCDQLTLHNSRLSQRPPVEKRGRNSTARWFSDLSPAAFKRYRLQRNVANASRTRTQLTEWKLNHQCRCVCAQNGRARAAMLCCLSKKKKTSASQTGKGVAAVVLQKLRRSFKKSTPLGSPKRVPELTEKWRNEISGDRSDGAREEKESSLLAPKEIVEGDAVSPSSDHEYDVYICHESHDVKTAMCLLETIQAHGLRCLFGERDFMPGSPILSCITEAVTSSRKVVLLLSHQFLQNGMSTFELQMSLSEMYDTQRALIVPVLLDVTEAEVPICLKNLSLVDCRRDPNYVRKLVQILKGPDINVSQLMPAGNVAYGLAWSYYFYLRIVLKGIAQRVDKFCTGTDCKDPRMPRKLFILVSASCFCPPSLESADTAKRITFGGHLETITKTSAGSVDRHYKNTVWNIQKDNGQVIQFVGEYSNVVHTMYEMDCAQIAGMDTYQMQRQRDQFLDLLRSIIRQYNHDSQATLIFIQDTEEEERRVALSDVLEPAIERERLPCIQ